MKAYQQHTPESIKNNRKNRTFSTDFRGFLLCEKSLFNLMKKKNYYNTVLAMYSHEGLISFNKNKPRTTCMFVLQKPFSLYIEKVLSCCSFRYWRSFCTRSINE